MDNDHNNTVAALRVFEQLVYAACAAALVDAIDKWIALLEAENAALPNETPADVEDLRVVRYRLLKLGTQIARGEIGPEKYGAEIESIRQYLREAQVAIED